MGRGNRLAAGSAGGMEGRETMRTRSRRGLSGLAVTAAVLAMGAQAYAGTPSVQTINPVNNATGVAIDTSVAADLNLPNGGGVDEATLTETSVTLTKVSSGVKVA